MILDDSQYPCVYVDGFGPMLLVPAPNADAVYVQIATRKVRPDLYCGPEQTVSGLSSLKRVPLAEMDAKFQATCQAYIQGLKT